MKKKLLDRMKYLNTSSFLVPFFVVYVEYLVGEGFWMKFYIEEWIYMFISSTYFWLFLSCCHDFTNIIDSITKWQNMQLKAISIRC